MRAFGNHKIWMWCWSVSSSSIQHHQHRSCKVEIQFGNNSFELFPCADDRIWVTKMSKSVLNSQLKTHKTTAKLQIQNSKRSIENPVDVNMHWESETAEKKSQTFINSRCVSSLHSHRSRAPQIEMCLRHHGMRFDVASDALQSHIGSVNFPRFYRCLPVQHAVLRRYGSRHIMDGRLHLQHQMHATDHL